MALRRSLKPHDGAEMIAAEQFEEYRPLLFSIAYRMLGSASDAEDVIQDAWVRSSDAQPRELRSAKAWLTTVVTRLCLDRLKSARAAREQYVGPWLPEPVLTSLDGRPDAMLQRDESVTLASPRLRATPLRPFLVLLETLTPDERAVFLLNFQRYAVLRFASWPKVGKAGTSTPRSTTGKMRARWAGVTCRSGAASPPMRVVRSLSSGAAPAASRFPWRAPAQPSSASIDRRPCSRAP